jgi:FeS assembly SUF system protein
MVAEKDVIKVLRTCYDPEIPINIYDLGLIYNIDIVDDAVKVKLTLTSRGCPMSQTIKYEVTEKIKRIEGCKGAEIEVVWDPPWTPEKMTDEAKRLLGISV